MNIHSYEFSFHPLASSLFFLCSQKVPLLVDCTHDIISKVQFCSVYCIIVTCIIDADISLNHINLHVMLTKHNIDLVPHLKGKERFI